MVGSGKKCSTSAVNRPATADPDNSEPVRQNRNRSSMKRVPRFARQGAARIHPANLHCSPSRQRDRGPLQARRNPKADKSVRLARTIWPDRPDSQTISDSGPIVGIGGCAGGVEIAESTGSAANPDDDQSQTARVAAACPTTRLPNATHLHRLYSPVFVGLNSWMIM